ncbi:hypothetical protein D915_001257 [Fasciola hepatica]|uniref:Uncharacterized protein n=1 Tax=Fasciola hepatica TaxID=6192 RepID=A0A4E0RZ96_FASHE|nr:hypothetical protein D915_001257 [Fasciola hepatica]
MSINKLPSCWPPVCRKKVPSHQARTRTQASSDKSPGVAGQLRTFFSSFRRNAIPKRNFNKRSVLLVQIPLHWDYLNTNSTGCASLLERG